jgi:hypothetical protein
MLFCDGVIREQGTGKITLINTFAGLAARTFPCPPRELHVYIELTSFVGDADVRLVCVRADVPEPYEVYAVEYVAHLRGKLSVEQLHFVLSQFQVPSPGEYVFQLWSQGQCIAERRLTIRQMGE